MAYWFFIKIKKKKKDKSWRCCGCLVPDKQHTQWVFKMFLRVTAMHDVLHFRECASVIFSCRWSSENTTVQMLLLERNLIFIIKKWSQKFFFFFILGVSTGSLSVNMQLVEKSLWCCIFVFFLILPRLC